MNPEKCVRLRADPSRVRVGIRKIHSRWLATVGAIDGSWICTASRNTPEQALEEALSWADGYDGVDVRMKNVYIHPFCVESKL